MKQYLTVTKCSLCGTNRWCHRTWGEIKTTGSWSGRGPDRILTCKVNSQEEPRGQEMQQQQDMHLGQWVMAQISRWRSIAETQMIQRKTSRERVGKGDEGKKWGGKKMRMNHLISGWECWLMASRGSTSSPIICQKYFGLVAKGNLGENSLLKYLNVFPKPLLLFFLFGRIWRKALYLLTKNITS